MRTTFSNLCSLCPEITYTALSLQLYSHLISSESRTRPLGSTMLSILMMIIARLTVFDVRISKQVLAMYTMIEQCHIRRYSSSLILVEDGSTVY